MESRSSSSARVARRTPLGGHALLQYAFPLPRRVRARGDIRVWYRRGTRPDAAGGTLAGNLPTSGGIALATWGGGSVDNLATAAAAKSCTLSAVWVLDASTFVGNVPGAPSVVNATWNTRFPGGPPSGVVILVCRGPQPTVGARSIAGCPLFPDDNAWTRDISSDPIDSRSDAYIAYILGSGGNKNLHADFGSDPTYGIPYVVVPESQATSNVTFDYADESDRGPYPIPANVPIEAGSDRHALIVQQGSCRLYELFGLEGGAGSWRAGSGAIFDLKSNALRPDGWTSADAAGLPIFPGLVRYDEVRAGAINHALRFTVSNRLMATSGTCSTMAA